MTPLRILAIPVLLLAQAAGRPLPAQTPAPLLLEVSPPAGQPGATTRVTLSGKHLEKVRGLWFDRPGFKAVLHQENPSETPAPPPKEPPAKEKKRGKKESSPKPGQPSTLVWDVSVDPSVAPGLYDLRAVNDLGVSAPRAFHVSPHRVVTDRDPAEQKPVEVEVGSRIFGSVEPGLVERFHLKAARAQRVVVECLGERIDSKLDGVLEVRDREGRRAGFSGNRIGRDPALAFDAREGGEYTIELWDLTYGGKYPYLLSISADPRVLFGFPPALECRAETEMTFYGWNLPGSRPVDWAEGPLEALQVKLPPPPEPDPSSFVCYRNTSELIPDTVEVRFPGPLAEPMTLARARAPSLLEREPNDSPSQAMPLEPPCEVSGRFGSHGDRDWYSFHARKGQEFEIEVESARLGAPCDPLLLIARPAAEKPANDKPGAGKPAAGKPAGTEPGTPDPVRDLLFLDERKSGFPREEPFSRKFVASERDPVAIWSAPEDGDFLLQVRNRNGRQGPEAIYRLILRPPSPDFSLVVIHSENQGGEALTVPRGGSQSYDVMVERSGGFAGVIEVTAEGLPAGVTCPPVYLGPGESYVPLIFTASLEAADWTGSVRVVGSSHLSGVEGKESRLLRAAAGAVMVYGGKENRHPLEYIHSRMVNGLLLSVREAAPFQVQLEPRDRTVAPGAKVSFRARVARRAGFTEGIQLAYQGLSERAMPDENGVRPAKTTLQKDRAEEDLSFTVKNDAPYGEHTFMVYATAPVEYAENPLDPKSKKEKRRATFVSNPVTVRLAPPFSLVAAGLAPEPAVPGGTLRVPFEVRRLPGVEAEVEVALELPKGQKGFAAEPVKLPKDKSAGEILVKCDPKAGPGKAEGALLRATMQFAGRKSEEKVLLPFALERGVAGQEARTVPAGERIFEIAGAEEARLGALRIQLRRRPGAPSGELRFRLKALSPSGTEAVSELSLAEGKREGAVLLDSSPLERGKGREPLLPLRIRISTAIEKGERLEEHILQAIPYTARHHDRPTRSF